jgi:exosortase
MSSSAIPTEQTPNPSSTKDPLVRVLVPYLVAVLAQLPLLFLYFKSLWNYKPHYQFIPFAVAAVAFLAYVRWPRDSRMPFHRSLLSDGLLILGLFVGLTNCLFIEPWLAAVSCFLLTASLFARTFDSYTGKSLFALSLPLLVCIVPPKRGDMWIITKLQRISAHFTSQLLDVVGYGHHMPGTVVRAPGTEGFGIAEACSGVQSFFTLLFVAVVFAVWNRRPWFRSSVLVISTIFWAILMNTIRIFAIPMADKLLDMDLTSGVSHMLLGYSTLALGILLLFSTDQFLLFLFGPVDADAEREGGGLSRFIPATWNRTIAGTEDEEAKKRRKARRRISSVSAMLILIVGGVMALGGIWQLVDVGRSLFSSTQRVQFFQSIISHPYEQQDLPPQIEGWALSESTPYQSLEREHGNDLGLHSDTWTYIAPRQFPMIVSLDQTFPGWHELTICYQNQGWKLDRRTKRSGKIAGTDEEWPYIEAEFSKNTGEKAFLVFSLFDVFGGAYDPPATWNSLDFYISRIRNRLSQRVRAQLFRGETFQSQAFVSTFNDLNDTQKQQITDRYLKLREQLRTKFIERREAEVGGGA